MSNGGKQSKQVKKGTRSSGRKTIGGTRKRRRESVSEEEDMNVIEEEEDEEFEIEGFHEDDFIRKIIEEEKEEIFM